MPRGPRRVDEPLSLLGGDPGDGAATAVDDAGAVGGVPAVRGGGSWHARCGASARQQ